MHALCNKHQLDEREINIMYNLKFKAFAIMLSAPMSVERHYVYNSKHCSNIKYLI